MDDRSKVDQEGFLASVGVGFKEAHELTRALIAGLVSTLASFSTRSLPTKERREHPNSSAHLRN
jgi:hypothetical protein